MENFQVYRDIQARTGGDIYIGVVGPVRTGKSTFIRRFMELVALPDMEPAKQAEVRDQLPLSGSGKLITTVEPKFIPKEAVNVNLGDDQKVQIRLIDCVGFLVKDASGHIEDGRERMVKTPWFDDMDFRLNTFSISSDNRGELMEVEQTGHQIIAALTPNAAGMQQSGMNMNNGMQQPGGLWKCQCGAENTGRFCEYCGQPRPF